jgi:3-oxoacyl-[acyl-carrier-protein] synthase-1
VTPLAVTAFTATSAVGSGNEAHASALASGRGGLRRNDFTSHALATWIGRVDGLEAVHWPAQFAACDCRNNRLAWKGLQPDGFRDAVGRAITRHGATRVALVLGTSTSSIGATEEAYARLGEDGQFPMDLRRPEVHTPHSLGHFVAQALGVTGPCVTVATACSSSAKVFAQAERLIRLGLVDAAVVGGVDTLCGSALFGFNSLELISREPCRPFDRARSGISLGEAAGYALLERDGEAQAWFIGHGESSDAYHMSSPHPDGLGARLAIQAALARARITPGDIDYINLHGTASQKNDEVEAVLIADLFPPGVAASSTKGWTGHTLGAAGIIEAVICMLSMRHDLRPGTLNTAELDACCGPQIRLHSEHAPVDLALTQSFGFGGNNCVLVFAKSAPAR